MGRRFAFEIEKGKHCTCPDWPCDESTCTRCSACRQRGRPFYSRAERRWLDTGEEMEPEEVERLRRLSGDHGAASTRLYAMRRDAQATEQQDDIETKAQSDKGAP